MRTFLCLALFWGLHISVHAQVELSGQINSYHVLTGYDLCSNTISVADVIELEEGFGIVILQMRGASINESNSSSFGTINADNGIGQYEYNRIVAINGNELTLAFEISNNYSLNGFTQVIGFPIYEQVTVVDAIVPAAWNGSTGGVVAVEASVSIDLVGNIDASGQGFRGGSSIQHDDINCNFLTFNDNYFYETGNWRGSPKGEGVADIIPGKEYGRGAQANGGGGGNNHNAGGGGGANVTKGGQGGENNEPSFGGCDGFYPGEGGKALPNTESLLFLGGGGGSGHRNNPNNTAGADGGGIIIVITPALSASGGAIVANGTDANSPNGDGAGGGGAGGTVLLITDNLPGGVPINVQGGAGGSVDNNNQERCFGPGGGGSGGRLLSNQAYTATLGGGAPGLSTASASCGEGTNGATAGQAGLSNTNLNGIVRGAAFQVPAIQNIPEDVNACIGDDLSFTADVSGTNLNLQWQINTSDNWTDINEDATFSGSATNTLSITDNPLMEASYRLVLQTDTDCPVEIISDPFQVLAEEGPSAMPTISVDGNTVSFQANADNTDAFSWQLFGEEISGQPDDQYTFTEAGDYEITLLIANDCGSESFVLPVMIGAPPVAAFSANRLAGCAPLFIAFTDESEGGEATNRMWTFEGGDPATSMDAAPTVVFSEPGSYEVNLVVENASGSSSSTQTVTVVFPPQPDFDWTADNLQVSFQNLSGNASLYTWNFGDDTISEDENPVHTFSTPGVYEITLNAQNEFCGAATSQLIEIFITSTDSPWSASILVFPNPTWELLTIQGEFESGRLFNAQGQVVQAFIAKGPITNLELQQLPAGIYHLELLKGTARRRTKVVKM